MGGGRWPKVIFNEGMSENLNFVDETKQQMDAKMEYLP